MRKTFINSTNELLVTSTASVVFMYSDLGSLKTNSIIVDIRCNFKGSGIIQQRIIKHRRLMG